MKYFLLFMLLLNSLCINAQIEKDVIDEFTGTHTIVTEQVTLNKGMLTSFTTCLAWADGHFLIDCYMKSSECFYVSENHSVFLKFDDGTTKKAICIKSAVAEHFDFFGGFWWTDLLHLPEEGTLEKLANHYVTAFRYETSIGNYDETIKKKSAIALQQQARALIDRLKEHKLYETSKQSKLKLD